MEVSHGDRVVLVYASRTYCTCIRMKVVARNSRDSRQLFYVKKIISLSIALRIERNLNAIVRSDSVPSIDDTNSNTSFQYRRREDKLNRTTYPRAFPVALPSSKRADELVRPSAPRRLCPCCERPTTIGSYVPRTLDRSDRRRPRSIAYEATAE